MKKLFVFIAALAIMTTGLAVAAANEMDSPGSYTAYTDYEEYVQSLLDDGLITQKGADTLLEEYNGDSGDNDATSSSTSFAGCFGRGRGYAGGYGRHHAGGYGGGYGGCWR